MEIYKALLAVKSKLPYLQKSTKSFQYNYNSPSQVLAAVNPLLIENNLFLKTEVVNVKTERICTGTQFDKNLQKVVEKWETLYQVELLYTFVHTESGETDVNRFFASGLNNDEKGFGSALTYGERYFLLKFFNIACDSDDPDAFQQKQLSKEEIAEIQAKQKIEEEKKYRYANVEIWIIESDSRKKLSAVWAVLNAQEREFFSAAVEAKTKQLDAQEAKKQ